MLQISGRIVACLVLLLSFLTPVSTAQSGASAIRGRAVIDRGSSSSYHATTTFRTVSSSSTPIFPTSSFAVPKDLAGSRSNMKNIAYPIIIGLSVCVVIGLGVTYVFFRQRAQVRRAAAQAAMDKSPATSNSNSGVGASEHTGDTPMARAVEEQPVPSTSRGNDLSVSSTSGGA
ncbi:hypothetical protein MVEN_01954700 [Mycena venus]|uniref:Transmembrane protein n=1 Tax=Mycena venus TaxID=2733690 RepID=A0A8H6XHA7_9AGAR|nr:hypothetical protein MVEN_01954700 [Mycena venus]